MRRNPDRACLQCVMLYHPETKTQRFCSNRCVVDWKTARATARTEKRCPCCNEHKPLESFAKSAARVDGRQSVCKQCGLVYRRGPGQRTSDIKRRFGISNERFIDLLAIQGNVCAICGGPPKGRGMYAIDHDHSTGALRGILCTTCNTGMGCFHDDTALLEKATRYLRKHSGNS